MKLSKIILSASLVCAISLLGGCTTSGTDNTTGTLEVDNFCLNHVRFDATSGGLMTGASAPELCSTRR